MKALIATEKPFARVAVDGIKSIFEGANIETVLLEKYTDKSQFISALQGVDALIVRSDKVDKEIIEAAPKLKIVVRAGAGYDNLDLESCTNCGVVAMNTPGQNSNAVAELVILLMLYMARNAFNSGTGIELKGKRFGIHAYGNIGKIAAKLAKNFGMEVLTFRPTNSFEGYIDGIKMLASAKELYSTCDFVSLHIPANEKTKRSINKSLLSVMPNGAVLINTARKEIINEDDLIEVMKLRTDLKYACDVAPSAHIKMQELFGNRYFGTAKKIGAETSEANINAAYAAANQIVAFFKTGNRQFQVNT